MGKIFGTDGARGEANSKLSVELAYQIGRSAAYVLGNENVDRKKGIVIGKDTRISGDMLEAALIAGICSVGVDVYRLGVVPTPAVAFLTRKLETMAGVVISASHNPFQDNGIKFFNQAGLKLTDQQEEAIETLIFNQLEGISTPVGAGVGRVYEVEDGGEQYCQYLKTCCSGDLTGLNIVVDCANGAASNWAPKLLEQCGAKVTVIFAQPDGVNINSGCGSTHLGALQKKVVEVGADLGIAYDGDADRLLAVDHEGNIVDGDQIITICALDLQQKGLLKDNKVVVTVMSNLGLKQALQGAGIEVSETKVGDRYVLEEMLANGAVIGGEQSGHVILSQYNSTGDGMLTSIKLLDIVKHSGKTLGQLAGQMERLPQILINVSVKTKEGWDTNPTITTLIRKHQEQLADQGRILVRASGTENLLRVMVEGKDQAYIETICKDIADLINQELNK